MDKLNASTSNPELIFKDISDTLASPIIPKFPKIKTTAPRINIKNPKENAMLTSKPRFLKEAIAIIIETVPTKRSEERRVGKECRYRCWRYDTINEMKVDSDHCC